jgi:branched-chain amino acid transport system permease protein
MDTTAAASHDTRAGIIETRTARGNRTFLVATLVMALMFVVAPFVGVYPVFLMKALCFALYACAFNLLIGYGGLLSFGHAMFLGVAGYASAYTAKNWGFPPELAILFATALSALLGLVSGLIAIRRQGIYFAMITLALSQMIFFFCLQATSITGGEDGIQSVPRGRMFGVLDLSNTLVMYYVVLAIFLAAFLLIPPHHPFAVRQRAEDDPRQRAARDFTRLRRRALQAARVRAFRHADGDSRARRRRSSSSSRRSPTCTGRCPARSC